MKLVQQKVGSKNCGPLATLNYFRWAGLGQHRYMGSLSYLSRLCLQTQTGSHPLAMFDALDYLFRKYTIETAGPVPNYVQIRSAKHLADLMGDNRAAVVSGLHGRYGHAWFIAKTIENGQLFLDFNRSTNRHNFILADRIDDILRKRRFSLYAFVAGKVESYEGPQYGRDDFYLPVMQILFLNDELPTALQLPKLHEINKGVTDPLVKVEQTIDHLLRATKADKRFVRIKPNDKRHGLGKYLTLSNGQTKISWLPEGDHVWKLKEN